MSDETTTPPPSRFCAKCFAAWNGNRPTCWLCGAPQELAAPGAPRHARVLLPPFPLEPYASPPPVPTESHFPPPLPLLDPQPFQFSLNTLMLAMTLIAVLCGLCVSAPGLGIPLAILAVPAWIRASRALRIDTKIENRQNFGNKIEKFFVSLGAVILAALAAGAAGFAACTVICYAGVGLNNNGGRADEAAFQMGLMGGAVVVLAMFIWLSIKFWPKKKPPEMK